jgi:hypothetical protein
MVNTVFEKDVTLSKPVAFAICVLVTVPAMARVITVDDDGAADFNDIQQAIVHSADGDIVEVRPGVYRGNINFYGKAITVTSTDADDPTVVGATIIDRRSKFHTIRFDCGEDNSSVLTGFTIRATNLAKFTGYGIYCYYACPLISKNVIFQHDIGVQAESGYPGLLANYIRDNNSTGIVGCAGEITNCRIERNGGHGVYDCDGTIVNCVVASNASGGLVNCDGLIANCLVHNNTTGLGDCDGQVTNCTIAYNLGGDGLESCEAEIKNCIAAFNGRYGLNNCTGSTTYNDVWDNAWGNYAGGTLPGAGDTHADPLFAAADDYHVASEAGRWDAKNKQWVIDDVTSPCVDAGDPNDSIGYERNPNGGRINVGAYGGTMEASKSPYATGPEPPPVCLWYPPMDFNKDCKVDFADFSIFIRNWLDCNLDPESACWE